MKRSQINRSIATAAKAFDQAGLHLPPFAFWTPGQWASKGREADEIRRAQLGWDVTDFGSGDFPNWGRTLFTLRNGYRANGVPTKSYGEKFILNLPNQKPPLHFHQTKMEDIINRAGGNVLIRLFSATPDGQCSDEDFDVQVNGETLHLKPDTVLRLTPGESICVPPRLIHQFWGEEGTGFEVEGVRCVISGEVSSFCDDWGDNCFLAPAERFPVIDEDEPRLRYLCHEYPAAG
jgi:hypothetical protein